MNTQTKKKGSLPLPARILISIAVLATILFLGVVGYLWIQERSVPKELEQLKDYEAVIVLGAQVKADGTPSVQLSWRLDKAKEAYEQYSVPVVVCGAQGGDEPAPEAIVMKQYLLDRGVPEEMILTDPDSFNTYENLQNAQRLLKEHGTYQKVLIVTSDYHVPRSLAIARDLGLSAEGLGSPCLPEYWIKNHFREALAWGKYWLKKIFHI